MKADACRSCKAPVVWVQTEKGRLMPVDAEGDEPKRVDGGNLTVIGATRDGVPVVRYGADGDHVSHFATCPNAKDWRKK